MIQYIKNEQVWDGGAINIPSYTTSTPTDDEMILGGYHKETPKATEENPEPQEGWYDAEGNEYAGEEITIPEMTMFSPQPADLIANGYEAVEIEEPALTEEELLEKAKLNKIQQIVAYDRSSNVNSFNLGEQSMWLNVNQRQQIATQISANEAAGRTEMTRWFHGVSYTFPLSSWKQMLVAIEVYAGDALNVTESHKAAVNALDSVEAVEAYDITAGYPEKLSF